ncbi:MAG: hypothetical protein V4543_05170 [Bacteroidota bacterium]
MKKYKRINIIGIIFSSVFLVLSVSGCRQEWFPEEKESFLASCMNGADYNQVPKAKEFCDCYQQKTEKKYPNYDVRDWDTDTLEKFRNQCHDSLTPDEVIWPEVSRNAFMKSCLDLPDAKNQPNPAAWCSCVLEKVITKFPDTDKLAALTQDSLHDIGRSCVEPSTNQKP